MQGVYPQPVPVNSSPGCLLPLLSTGDFGEMGGRPAFYEFRRDYIRLKRTGAVGEKLKLANSCSTLESCSIYVSGNLWDSM
jgi:hypothetical protein